MDFYNDIEGDYLKVLIMYQKCEYILSIKHDFSKCDEYIFDFVGKLKNDFCVFFDKPLDEFKRGVDTYRDKDMVSCCDNYWEFLKFSLETVAMYIRDELEGWVEGGN